MSTVSPRDVPERFPIADVIAPAVVAGVLVTLGVFLVGVSSSPPPRISSQLFSNTLVNRAATSLIGAIGTIGLIAAILALFRAGTDAPILVGGAVVAYVAAFVASLVNWLYAGASGTIDLALFLTPTANVLLFLGIALGARWVEADGRFG